ncbi:alpha-hydroxy acid oxidase [Salipiger thiooxidans]|uniref:alpha-hydroxy acid oxidase n=1 Tax=Salipiger thiooxidans TaxID=282683 RepID=UPI001CD4B01E|nr:alpha-hydroxy acid oxidase [Salipiger thiooxidans]MCA0851250.1 alpha-hydroxy-acid oxidizing protein [Salipiger thiooxidans]
MSPDADGWSIIARKPRNTTARRLRGILSLGDFRASAEKRLPKPIFGYVDGSVETGSSLRNNRAALDSLHFLPRILRDVSARSTACSLLGSTHEVPFAIAPMGFSALVAPDGDVALARGAASIGSFAICSAAGLTPLERVAQDAGSTWFQCYVPGNRARIQALVGRLLSAEYETLVVTADVPVAANRENNARNGFDAPFRLTPRLAWQFASHPRWTIGTLGREIAARGMPHFENMDAEQGPPLFSRTLTRSTVARDRLSWDDMEYLRDIWPGKLVLKGVLAPDDAVRSRRIGMDAIVVSNHGGRQLDSSVAPLSMLPAIRAAVPEMPILLDGSLERGTDVLKALALGADFVLVGRPFLFAAATDGEAGVTHAARLLKQELMIDMALLGISSLGELGPNFLQISSTHAVGLNPPGKPNAQV